MSAPLAKSARAQLEHVLADYETARFGRLNETADALNSLCAKLGWRRWADGTARAWAHTMIDGDNP